MGPHTSQCKTPVQVIMSLETKKTGPGQVLHESVPRVIRELLNTEPHADTDRVYRRAVGLVVQKLLSQVHRNDAPPSLSAAVDGSSCLEEMAQQIGPLTPAEVGEIYEYLRGFKLEIKSPEQSVMVPNIMGKRNQGLFYTPKVIVSYIVEQTLDAMAVRRTISLSGFENPRPGCGYRPVPGRNLGPNHGPRPFSTALGGQAPYQ